MRDLPDFRFESLTLARGHARVAGVDEVGRGPLAGPVTAAAVRLDPDRIPPGLRDSKQLSAKRRAELAAEIEAVADVAIAHASVEEIEEVNILRAAERAMARAVARLSRPPDHLLIDGNRIPPEFRPPRLHPPYSAEAIVRGDARCLSIAAASIVAKVARDALMVDLAQQYPGYGWDHNAGYPTPDHLNALKKLGVTPVHRRSFKPVHNILYQAVSITP